MLSIGLIKSSAAATSYYEKDDYYTEGETAQGEWFGAGAEALDLAGGVEKNDFEAVLEGRLPDGQELGRWVKGERQHTPGWDLTFSAPKSASVLYEIGGDAEVLKAHQTAVKEAVSWVQDHTASARRKGLTGMLDEKTGNVVAALFQHDTSRNQDPQLHTHAVIANMTQSPDGTWRSLNSKHLYDYKMAVGNIYRAALAERLMRLGYDIERVSADGSFEVAGVPEAVLKEFSTRRQEIEASLEKRGLDGAEASAKAALMTRAAKQPENREELKADWAERSAVHGYDAQATMQVAGHNRMQRTPGDMKTRPALLEKIETFLSSKPVPNQDGLRYVQVAAGRLSEQEATFSHAKLLQWTLAEGMGKINAEQAQTLIDEARKGDKPLLYAADINGKEGFTTQKASEQESRIDAALIASRGVLAPMVDKRSAASFLKTTHLNAGQRSAAKLIASSKDRFVAVIGRPGSGKSTMLNTANQLAKSAGYTMLGMATTSETARDLGEGTGMDTNTLAGHLNQVQRRLDDSKTLSPAEKQAFYAEFKKQVWVVDEASQIGNKDMDRLTRLSSRLGNRLVLVGDTQQIASIDAGKPMARMLDRGIRHAELNEILRQNKTHHLEAAQQAIAGNVSAALQNLQGETIEIADKQQRFSHLVNQWLGASDKANTLVLTATNKDKNALNDQIRSALRERGELKDEKPASTLQTVGALDADRKYAQTYAAGQQIRFLSDYKSLGVSKNEYWSVVASDPRSNTVTLEKDGKTLKWNPRELAGASDKTAIFNERESSVGVGENIVWSRVDRELGLANGQKLTVVGHDKNAVIARTEDGRDIRLDNQKPSHRHWDHAYASTVYKSQGKTAQTVLVNADSNDKALFSQKSFLVSITRQRDHIHLATDNKAAFEGGVQRNTGDKTSALESREAYGDRLWGRLKEALAVKTSETQSAAKAKEAERARPQNEREV